MNVVYTSNVEYDKTTDEYLITIPEEILKELELNTGDVLNLDCDEVSGKIVMTRRGKLTKSEIVEQLKESVCSVTFEKVNGEVRKMRCTLQESLLPKQESTGKKKEFPDAVVSVWDLDKDSWRSFRIESILTFSKV